MEIPKLEDVKKAIHINEYFTEDDIIKETYEAMSELLTRKKEHLLKHTPGPWEIYQDLENKSHFSIVNSGKDIIVLECDSFRITGKGHLDNEIKPNEYDLKLIVTAPDMLEALIYLYIIYLGKSESIEWVGNLIEKATGQKIEDIINEDVK